MINSPESKEISSLDDVIKSLQRTIDTRKNNITTLDAEITRLKQMGASEKYAVEQLILQKTDLEKQTKEIEDKLSSKQKEIDKLDKSIDGLKKEEDALTKSVSDMKTSIAQSEKDIKNQQEEIKKEKEILEKEKSDLNKREEKVAKLSLELTEKQNLIKELAIKL